MSGQNQFKQGKINFKEHKKSDSSVLLEIELENPQKLNVLTFDMIKTLNKGIRKWRDKKELSALFLHARGDKAFCAGGDVVQIRSLIFQGKAEKKDPALITQDFFQTEYETNYILAHFPKPVVLWGNGIVMGGGMGLFMASSHPIVTETSLLAMPEIRIGFFPDVGVSFYFPQIQKGLGKYLALTACRLNALETHFLKLTKWAYLNENKYNVLDFLCHSSFKDKDEWNDKWKSFYKEPDFLSKQNNWMKQFQDSIVAILKHKTLKDFFHHLQKTEFNDKKWQCNREIFLTSSPTSLAIVWEQFERSKHFKNLKSFFEMELKIALNMTRHFDFPEGIRALLVDKTKNPKWQPGSIEDINPVEINSYFTESKLNTCLRV